MNDDQIKTFGEKLSDKIEAKYQEILKDKLDLIFCGPDGISRPNGMTHKMMETLTKKWKVEKISTVEKLKLKRAIKKKLTWPVKFLSDFHGGYAVILIKYNFKPPEYNIVDKEGNLKLRNNTKEKPKVLMGHMILEDGARTYIFDERHNAECRYYTTLEGDFHEGYARVEGSKNFMNDDGKLLLSQELHYGNFSDFHEGYARFNKGDYVDYMDHNGNFLFGRIGKDHIQVYIHDYEDVALWIGPSPYEEGGDFHNGYARVKKNGKWNLIDYQGKEVFPEFYDDLSDVEFGRVKAKKDGQDQTIYIEMRNYQIEKVHGEYECTGLHEKFTLKHQPIKNYNLRFTLCTDGKNYYIYDKYLKKDITLGPVDSFIYDGNFIYDLEDKTMYLVYDQEIVDITEYYMKHLKDKETISISPRVTGIISRDTFRFKNNDEIEQITQEAKEENIRIIEAQRKEKENQDIEQAKIESEQAEKERLENLRQALADLKDAIERIKKYSRPGEAPRRIPISIPFVPAGDHYELPVEIKGIMKYIDISCEPFINVNVEGVDFSDCNPHILDPQLVYRKSLRGCKFDRVYINPFTNYAGVDIRGCSFSDDGNPLTVDIFNQSFARAIYDETTTYNGISMTEIIKKEEVDPSTPKM